MTHHKNIARFLFALIVLSSCGPRTEPIKLESETDGTGSQDRIHVSIEQFQTSQMTTGKMEMKDFHQVVRVNGMIDVPPQNYVSVSPYFGGYVKEVYLLPGEKIRRGQTLFVLENPEYVKIQQEFLEAQAQLDYLKSDYERQENLAEENVSSQKKYLKAKSDYTVTRARYESLRQQLRLMNIDPDKLTLDNIRTTLILPSTTNGYVSQMNITRGKYVNPFDVAMTIVDTDHMHLELKIFEKDMARVAAGQTIVFKLQDNKDQTYNAKVHLVNKTVDPDNRTIQVHGHIQNKEEAQEITPGMYVEAEIYTKSRSAMCLPHDAIVELDSNFFILMLEKTTENKYVFVRKAITIGQTEDGYTEILNSADFKENATFLTSGAFNLVTE